MYAKVLPFILIGFLTLGIKNAGATPDLTLETEDGEDKCYRKFDKGTLKIHGLSTTGRGDPGDLGLPGLDGINGAIGYPGVPGPKGSTGERGERGVTGRQGLPGLRGYPGIVGPKGYPGNQGPEGPAGPRGPPGNPGRPGICPCKKTPRDELYEHEDDVDFWTPDEELHETCKFAPAGVESDTYNLGPVHQSTFKVYCNMTTKETCIRSGIKSTELKYNTLKKSCWLSDMGVDMKNIYELTTRQIVWLQGQSVSVRQTLKYHCLNSVPYRPNNVSSSVQLLTWNDQVIGPAPTDQFPFYYSVPPGSDGCSEGSTKWQSTIIELRSSNKKRLPIIDMCIGDFRGGDQRMYVESVELCFG